MYYLLEKNNEIDPFMQDLYIFCTGGNKDFLKKLQIYLHILETNNTLCRYLRKSNLNRDVLSNNSEAILQIDEEMI